MSVTVPGEVIRRHPPGDQQRASRAGSPAESSLRTASIAAAVVTLISLSLARRRRGERPWTAGVRQSKKQAGFSDLGQTEFMAGRGGVLRRRMRGGLQICSVRAFSSRQDGYT
jgi:hypothetical protein